MGYDLYKSNEKVKSLFNEADDVLGFSLSNVMFNGNEEELKQTKITQPAIFLHSIAKLSVLQETHSPSAVAGHSLGEFSSLVANNTISFKDGLKLVFLRSKAMQKSCESSNGTMAAILGLDDKTIKETCESFDGNVTAANFNCPGQVVISGELNAVKKICEKFNEIGARRSILLPVGGAFHSNLMNDAKSELKEAIHKTKFNNPSCPIYQNFTAQKTTNIDTIKENLINQLTAPVLWTQTINNMVDDGYLDYTEVGPGKVLQGLIRKINRETTTQSVLS
jgi:[acyl-carrier-protein] S-malonyltransferase